MPTGVNRDREYTPAELAFLMALDRYKRLRQRPHPSWAEVLEVAMQLSYAKADSGTEAEQGERFGRAIDRYCRKHRRKFPTACQVLSVLVQLGYRLTQTLT